MAFREILKQSYGDQKVFLDDWIVKMIRQTGTRELAVSENHR